ncbi:MAG: hypothetical protein GQ564_08760 [Bacteroidales bacterium]|nr:hypothetical protein [Bacteroidales bacterium]
MENSLLYKVYDFFNNIINPNDIKFSSASSVFMAFEKICPVTGLDISMQAKNSKFLSSSGVKWYYENDRKIFDKILAPRLTESFKSKDIKFQFKKITHSIRNADSNPRNNTRRAIKKLLNEKDSLFNNMQLIDKYKLWQAGMKSSLDS